MELLDKVLFWNTEYLFHQVYHGALNASLQGAEESGLNSSFVDWVVFLWAGFLGHRVPCDALDDPLTVTALSEGGHSGK